MIRTWIAVVILLAAQRAEAAPGGARCFAGTSTVQLSGHESKMMIVTSLDADSATKHVRVRTWTEEDPTERTRDYSVDPAAKTIEAEFRSGSKITGSFDGDPWKWTGYHTKASVIQETMTTDAKLAGDSLVIDSHTDGPLVSKRHDDTKAFDCNQLDAKIAALDAVPAGAQRLCYDGKDGDRHDIVETIVEPKRFRYRQWGSRRSRAYAFALDGTKLSNPDGDSGTLTAKSGVWTFTWSSPGPAISMSAEAAFSSAELTETLKVKARGDERTHTLHATAFDCKDLARRRDANRAEAASGDHRRHRD